MGSLAAEWDTLGWVKFRLGDYESASKYLESAWSVMQALAVGDHLGQVYEKLGKKQQAAQWYAWVLSALRQNGDPILRQRMTANLKSLAAEGIRPKKDAGDEVNAQGGYRVATIKEWGGGYKSATLGIAFTKVTPAPQVWFVSGADELKDKTAEVSKIKFRVSFPDDGPTRVVQQAILSCSEATKMCTLVPLPLPARVVPTVTPQIN